MISGPLKRAADTCRNAGIRQFETREGFTEISTGEWDGLAFEEVKERYPGEYEARGLDLVNIAPPGGESFAECFERVCAEFEKVLEDHPAGNICIFTHEGVMKMLNARLTGISLQDALKKKYAYGSSVCYLMDGRDVYESPETDPERTGGFLPDEEECSRLLDEFGTPAHVRKHCMAVAVKAEELCRKLNGSGAGLDEAAVKAGAMLHDVARTEKKHAKAGALWLNSRGYTALAAIVGDHMTLPAEEERVSEKSVVFLADKLVRGEKTVTLRERYFPEGLAEDQREYHEIRYRQAVRTAALMGLEEV